MKDRDLLLNVARMYYEKDMTQQEIASKIYVSRSRVSRMLKKARDLGLVEIIIKPSFENNFTIEKRLMERFGLKKALVAYSQNSGVQEEFDSVCEMGASYLDSILDNKSVLSLSRGKTVATMAERLEPTRTYPDMRIIQLAGSLVGISSPTVDEMYIVQRAASLYGCEFYRLLMPYLMENEESKTLFCQHGSMAQTIRLNQEVNVFVSGVDSMLFWTDYLSERDINTLLASGAIGCMWGYFFNINGEIVETALYKRMVIPDRDIFKRVETRICIANDRFKAHALLGALHGGLCNVLVTNSKIAEHLLQLDAAMDE